MYNREERTKRGLAWADSILIREKRKHLSKMSDTVPKIFGMQAFKRRNEEKYS